MDNNLSGSNIKQCPFCGGVASISYGIMDDTRMPYVECSGCAAGSDFYFTEEEAITAWNMRAFVPSKDTLDAAQVTETLRNFAEQARQAADLVEKQLQLIKSYRDEIQRANDAYAQGHCDGWAQCKACLEPDNDDPTPEMVYNNSGDADNE